MQASAVNPAETYDSYFVPAMFRPWAGLLLQQARLRPGERVLDVACGTGIVARTALEQLGDAAQVTGLDLNPAMRRGGKFTTATTCRPISVSGA